MYHELGETFAAGLATTSWSSIVTTLCYVGRF